MQWLINDEQGVTIRLSHDDASELADTLASTTIAFGEVPRILLAALKASRNEGAVFSHVSERKLESYFGQLR